MILLADVPPELLEKSITELLKLVVLGKVTGSVLEWVKKRIKELWDKKEYGFTPEPEVASGLQRVSKSDAYRRMKECIGNHPFLSLVKLGLRIEELSDEGKVAPIAKIKNDVYQKHGVKGVRILTMGSTGVLIAIIQYLSDMKLKENYSQADTVELFEKIIDDWTSITIFHQADQGQSKLERNLITYMDCRHELFFVFAIGNAGDQAKRAIASLNNAGKIRDRSYMFNLYSRKEDMVGRAVLRASKHEKERR